MQVQTLVKRDEVTCLFYWLLDLGIVFLLVQWEFYDFRDLRASRVLRYLPLLASYYHFRRLKIFMKMYEEG